MARTKNVTRDISQKEVHEFNPRLKVNARPVDTFVPAQRSSRAQTFAQNLGLATQIGGQLSDIKQGADKRGAQEGHEAFLRGDETPEEVEGVKAWFTSQNVKRESYLALKGQTDAIDVQTQISDMVLKTSDVGQLGKQLDILEEKMVEGAGKSVGYLGTFMPSFQRQKSQAIQRVQQKQAAEVAGEYLAMQGKKMGDKLKLAFEESIPNKPDGTRPTMEEVMSNELLYDSFHQMASPEMLRNMVRRDLSDIQAHAKANGIQLTRNQISKHMLDSMVATAIEYGMPELVDMADMKDPEGISLFDAMPSQVHNAKMLVKSADKNRAAQVLRAEKKVIQDREDDLFSAYIQLQSQFQQDKGGESGGAFSNAKSALTSGIRGLLNSPQFKLFSRENPEGALKIVNGLKTANDVDKEPSQSLINEAYAKAMSGDSSLSYLIGKKDELGSSFASVARFSMPLIGNQNMKAKTTANIFSLSKLAVGLNSEANTFTDYTGTTPDDVKDLRLTNTSIKEMYLGRVAQLVTQKSAEMGSSYQPNDTDRASFHEEALNYVQVEIKRRQDVIKSKVAAKASRTTEEPFEPTRSWWDRALYMFGDDVPWDEEDLTKPITKP